MTERKKQDEDIAKSGDALRRAAQRAREIAERTGTPLVTYKDGKVHKRMVAREPATEFGQGTD